MNRLSPARLVVIAATAMLAVGGGVALAAPTLGISLASEAAPPAAEDVDTLTDAGAPAAKEFDPASQPQTSLVDAASQQNTPVTEDTELGDGAPRAAVPAPQSKPAIGSPGCLPQYGEKGQCLPVVPPSLSEHAEHADPRALAQFWTCVEVRTLFPAGVALSTKADPLHLDANKDRIACGEGDPA